MDKLQQLKLECEQYLQENNIDASLKAFRGKIYCSYNGNSFIVDRVLTLHRKVRQYKDSKPVQIDLTSRLAKIENQAIKAFQ